MSYLKSLYLPWTRVGVRERVGTRTRVADRPRVGVRTRVGGGRPRVEGRERVAAEVDLVRGRGAEVGDLQEEGA